MDLRHHQLCTDLRAAALEKLFGFRPTRFYSAGELLAEPDRRFLIDILIYPLETETRRIEVAVTNGMSDQRMANPERSDAVCRRELIQYLPVCTLGHARRLQAMACLPLVDGFHLDAFHTLGWKEPAVEGTPWKHAFFLEPPLVGHQEFACDVGGDRVGLLWHIPISEAERAFKREHGSGALLDRMDAVGLSWVFDEGNRPALV